MQSYMTCGGMLVFAYTITILHPNWWKGLYAALYLYTLTGREENLKDTPLHYVLVMFSLKVAVEATPETDMTVHLTIKYFSSAVIWVLQFDVPTFSVEKCHSYSLILSSMHPATMHAVCKGSRPSAP